VWSTNDTETFERYAGRPGRAGKTCKTRPRRVYWLRRVEGMRHVRFAVIRENERARRFEMDENNEQPSTNTASSDSWTTGTRQSKQRG
jgi:hypothetical protein